jgi:hypothetical protein
MSNEMIPAPAPAATNMQTYVFSTAQAFEAAQRMATALSKSDLIPKEYKGNMPNALIALEVAQRIGASPLMIMQNLAVIHGRPSWSSQFIIAAINSCGRFQPLRFKIVSEGQARDFDYEVFESEWNEVERRKITKTVKKKAKILNRTCVAWTEDKMGTVLEGPEVSIEMACLEGWYDKSGSKWKTMPELMLRYRAAAFFGRLYAPDVLMGMQTAEELIDTYDGKTIDVTPAPEAAILDNINAAIKEEKQAQPNPEPISESPPEQPAIPAFDINAHKLDTQAGLKEATKALCALLSPLPPEERAAAFVFNSGVMITNALSRHGLGREKQRFTDLGIQIPQEAA